MTDLATETLRLDDTDNEALSLTTGAGYWTTTNAPSHGIRSMRLADGPHGLRVQDDENPDHLGLERSAQATCFPPAVTLASSWDIDLIEAVGNALGREARAAGVNVVLGPGLNIKRSPLCGRNFEYYSEDPLLAGVLAGAAARGLQAQGVAACLKHFAVNNQETDRLRVSANIDERPLREIYLRAFQIALEESAAWSVMSSYNRVNGVFASQNHWLLTDLLRNEWGFDGVMISDWGAVRDPVDAFKAGLDLRMPGRPDDNRIRQAWARGEIDAVLLDQTVGRMRLLCDRTSIATPAVDVDRNDHHKLVQKAAAESAVLLSNDGVLPLALKPGIRIAVVGELARQPRYQGAGSSRVNAIKVVSGLDALSARVHKAGAELEFASGYTLSGSSDYALIDEAIELAQRSDVVILFVGLPGEFEAEGRDRTTIQLPANQTALIGALQGTKSKVVVALSNGSVVTTSSWRNGVNAIVEFWLTGQAHGDAVADVLLGVVNPSGKLAETVPIRLEDTPAFLNFPGEHQNVDYGEGIYVGYRYYDARSIDVDYPFGHGLSYTTFEYSGLEILVRPLSDVVAFDAKIRIHNTGKRFGHEVVQLYVQDLQTEITTPPRELRGWKKIGLAPGEEATVEIAVTREQLSHWHSPSKSWVYPGSDLIVCVGGSSRDLPLKKTVTIPGETISLKLDEWATFGEWLDDPKLGSKLRELIEARGGLKGRMADLLADEGGGRDAVRAVPLATIVEFPGVPVALDDLRILSSSLTGSNDGS
ncbi:glycosyl hydrolase [Agrobacterium rhizogenes]|uniref:glycoside hydrolase family 3 C-terminal domain-containing protein n=1 Tax=Rhizobium rhizogenes TaxID=359 RepID=UPI001574A078|nr:glycoside hydrolase family 3 C-terminal domain-containing protein [Rhizobium rhizogenes]NTF59588.1 glycosyl hydrolase [Rhizobium rhizogenes]NTF79148.1 glycosyl hydrolase [Rhizobium rhizogenes]NTG18404.1 glycosyl hydrolase [Rhizobium rhizogenes]NTH55540.1 glycosyl hydrolase [Rhizobium rhizogenes]NTH75123.1 glycosyl hydrolase [Rhizobium rhizogenes]